MWNLFQWRYVISKKKTHEEYVKELAIKNPNVVVVDRYIDSLTCITHKCLIHDVLWETTPSRALQGVGCPQCHNERISANKTRNHEWYIGELEKVAPHIKVIGKYQRCTTPITHYCTLHDVEWDASPDNILRGHGCRICGKEKIVEKIRIPYTEYVVRLKEYNPNIICVGEYKDMTTKVMHRCLIDGCEWETTPAWLLSGRGCPKCSESHGERAIRNWLDRHNIQFTTQKKYDDCKAERLLPFDFYLPDYDLLIEYDGEQHYRPVDFFGGVSAYKKLVQHDTIKTNYCKQCNISLLRIPYYKDIETELNNYILTQ